MAKKESAEKAVRDIRRKTRRRFSAEEKIRIVIEGLRGEEESIASLCRREGIVANLYTRWSKEFLEADKKRLLGDTQREDRVRSTICARRTPGSRSSWPRRCSRTVCSKKRDGLRFARGRGVRVSASEKLELIPPGGGPFAFDPAHADRDRPGSSVRSAGGLNWSSSIAAKSRAAMYGLVAGTQRLPRVV